MAEELWPLYGQGLLKGKDSGLAQRPLRTFSLFSTYPFFSNGPLFLSGCQPKKQECITESLDFLSILVVGFNRDEELFSPQTSQSHGEFIGHVCFLDDKQVRLFCHWWILPLCRVLHSKDTLWVSSVSTRSSKEFCRSKWSTESFRTQGRHSRVSSSKSRVMDSITADYHIIWNEKSTTR